MIIQGQKIGRCQGLESLLAIIDRDVHGWPWGFFGPPVAVPEKNHTRTFGLRNFTGTGAGIVWVSAFPRELRVTAWTPRPGNRTLTFLSGLPDSHFRTMISYLATYGYLPY